MADLLDRLRRYKPQTPADEVFDPFASPWLNGLDDAAITEYSPEPWVDPAHRLRKIGSDLGNAASAVYDDPTLLYRSPMAAAGRVGKAMAGSAYDAASAPYRAYTEGLVDPESEAMNMAGWLMGGAAVPKRPANSVGMFGRPERISNALPPEMYAVHRSPIGPLGEFSTAGARMKVSGDFDGHLGDVIDAGDLFTVYPELASIPTRIGRSIDGGRPSGASSLGAQKQIEAYADDPDTLLSTILHETQHHIADGEGLPFGASNSDKFHKALRHMKFDDAASSPAQDLYDASAGEMLANAAQHSDPWSFRGQYKGRVPRGDWDAEMMRENPPDFRGLKLWDLTKPELKRRALLDRNE